MNVFNLVSELRQQNAQISLDGENIKLLASAGQLTPEQMSALKDNKAEVIAFLQQEQALLKSGNHVTTLTTSDFPLASIDEQQLEQWQQRYDIEDIYAATAMQSGMIFHAMNEEGSSAYINQLWLNLDQSINADLLCEAWRLLAQQQPIFRTLFIGFESHLQQLVVKKAEVPLQVIDHSAVSQEQHESEFQQWLVIDRKNSFDFSKAPLFRISLFRLSDGSHRLVWTYHHVLVDGWCSNLVLEGVMSNYQALLNSQPVSNASNNQYKNTSPGFRLKIAKKHKVTGKPSCSRWKMPHNYKVISLSLQTMRSRGMVRKRWYSVKRSLKV